MWQWMDGIDDTVCADTGCCRRREEGAQVRRVEEDMVRCDAHEDFSAY